MKTHRGVVDPVTLGIIAAVVFWGLLVGGWKPLQFLKPKPPTAELTKAQEDLAAAKTRADAAEKKLADAKAADEQRQHDQVQYAQQMVHGTGSALAVAPSSPEVEVAKSLNVRAETGLAAAIGQLPAEQAKQIDDAVTSALKAKDHEIEVLTATLKEKDATLQTTIKERDQLKVEIPVLTKDRDAAREIVVAKDAVVVAKTEEVKKAADALDAEKRQSGSLGAAAAFWVRVVIWAACIYGFLAIVLPGITGFMKSGPIKTALRAVSGWALNPLHHHDAATTIDDLKAQLAKLTTPPTP